MKRKILIIFIFLFVILPLTSSPSLRSKLLESPLKNIAYAREYSDGIINSSSFPFKTDDINFYVSSTIKEQYKQTPFLNNEKFCGLQNLGLDTMFSFGSDSLMLTGNIDSGLANKNIINKSPYYDVNTYNKLQLDAAFRYKFFSLGFRMEGGNLSQRAQREIDSIADVCANMLFEKFSPVSGSEYFSTGISTYFKFEDFGITVIVDELIKVLDSGSIGTSWKQILESLSLGFAYESPRYKNDGNLNFARFRAGLSFEHFLSPLNAVTGLTCDIDLQLLPDISVILGTGFRNLQRIDQLMKNGSLANTYQSFELKLKLLKGSVAFNVYYPLSVYKGWNENQIKFSITSCFYL